VFVIFRVGSRISTKWPDGKEHDPIRRLDVTDDYKHREGTKEERESIRRAVRFTSHGKRLFPENTVSVKEEHKYQLTHLTLPPPLGGD
jgi:hypothetical protein